MCLHFFLFLFSIRKVTYQEFVRLKFASKSYDLHVSVIIAKARVYSPCNSCMVVVVLIHLDPVFQSQQTARMRLQTNHDACPGF